MNEQYRKPEPRGGLAVEIKKMDAANAKGRTPLVLGKSACSVLKALGKLGWSAERAGAAIKAYGAQVRDNTVRINVSVGASGKGVAATLTDEEIALLEKVGP